ncbi:MAG: hypothetical protein QXN68_00815 [Thermoplasmata archaeon]
MKRLTETDKWVEKWFRDLDNKYKLLYLFMLDNCDYLGIFDLDKLELASFILKEKFSVEEVKKVFLDKIEVKIIDGKEIVVMKEFILWNYGDNLNPEHKIHKRIIEVLSKKSKKKEIDESEKVINDVVRKVLRYFNDWYKFLMKVEYNCNFNYEFNLVKNWIKFYNKQFNNDIEKTEKFIFDLVDIFFNEQSKYKIPSYTIGTMHKMLNKLVYLHNNKSYKFKTLEEVKKDGKS